MSASGYEHVELRAQRVACGSVPDFYLEDCSIARPCAPYPWIMWTLIIVLLVVWAILAIVGVVFEGLVWLAVIGAVLFVGTLIIGIIRQRARKPSG